MVSWWPKQKSYYRRSFGNLCLHDAANTTSNMMPFVTEQSFHRLRHWYVGMVGEGLIVRKGSRKSLCEQFLKYNSGFW